MPRTNTFVIVGGGLAAGKAAEELREHGDDGPLLESLLLAHARPAGAQS
ncbi:hypothetical protein [Streptomyces sp. NBC_01589]